MNKIQDHIQHESNNVAKDIFAGTIASATVLTGSKLIGGLARHPFLVFGLGVATGYFAYKYRKEIVSSTTRVVDAGKDFVLQQKENLEDIVAETKE
jgi:hypothetical protein